MACRSLFLTPLEKIRSIILSALCELVVHEEAEDFMDLWVRSKA